MIAMRSVMEPAAPAGGQSAGADEMPTKAG